MTQRQQINALSDEIDRVVDQFRDEFDLSYAAVVGVLQMKLFLMCQEADRAGNDPDHDPEPEE